MLRALNCFSAKVDAEAPAPTDQMLGTWLYSNGDAWSNFVGVVGRQKQQAGVEVGRYSVEQINDVLVYTEGPLRGNLTWDGEWFTATLLEKNQVEGEIRLRKFRQGVQSQFRKLGEEKWDGLIVAKRAKKAAVKQEKPCPEQEKLVEHVEEQTEVNVVPLVEPEVPLHQPDVQTSTEHQELEVKFKPSVGTWLLPVLRATQDMHTEFLTALPQESLPQFVSADLAPVWEQQPTSAFELNCATKDLDCNDEANLRSAVENFEPEDDVEETIFMLFKAIDANHDGIVNRTEFFSGLWGSQANDLLKRLGVADKHLAGTGHEVLQELFERADADRNGVITFFEFMTALKQQVGKDVSED
jgi:hypothetical protein